MQSRQTFRGGSQVMQGNLLLKPHASHKVTSSPTSASFADTDAPVSVPSESPPLAYILLAAQQGRLFSPLSWCDSSLGQGRGLVSCACNWQ